MIAFETKARKIVWQNTEVIVQTNILFESRISGYKQKFIKPWAVQGPLSCLFLSPPTLDDKPLFSDQSTPPVFKTV